MTLCADPRTKTPGVRLRVLDADGAELCTEHRHGGRQLEPPQPPGAHTVEISALLHPRVCGPWRIGIAGFGRLTLQLDERTLLDAEFATTTDDPAVIHVTPPTHVVTAQLAAGTTPLLVARRQLAPDTGRATVVGAAPPAPTAVEALAAAEAAAREADAAVVVVGTGELHESEGRDRTHLGLGADQDALVRAVARANPRTVAVVNSGGPVEMPWRDEVGALLLAWFPGQEAGGALADVLLGRTEPGGRLPTTWPARLTDAPVTRTRPEAGRVTYDEGVHVGHRGWLRTGRTPAYWFGHGLGYTTWRYEEITGPPHVVPGDGLDLRVSVRNTGPRPGREVVQVYVARPGAPDQPVRRLAGWTAVHARPGETAVAHVRIPARALRHWDTAADRWATLTGPLRILAGRSAGDLPLTLDTDVRDHA